MKQVSCYRPGLLVLTMLLAGCSKARAPYPEADSWPYQYQYRLVAPEVSTKTIFEDEDIAIAFSIGDTRIGFVLRNKTDDPVQVLWEQSAYIDGGGHAIRIIHRDVGYEKKDDPLPPSIVPAGLELSTEVLPAEYAFYVEYEDVWVESRLFPGEQELQPMYKGTIFGLRLTLKIREEIRPYAFRFKIAEVKLRQGY